jgi:hypothetical protein
VGLVAALVPSCDGHGGYPAPPPSAVAPSSIEPSPEGYWIRFEEPTLPGPEEQNGGATVTIETNLPDGTLVDADYVCCPPIQDGQLSFAATNGDCVLPPGSSRSTSFDATVRVRPSYPREAVFGGTNPPPLAQPPAVQAILGPAFERLGGAQVTVVNGVRTLVATATLEWPADSCLSLLLNNDLFMPAECATTDTRGHPLPPVQADDPSELLDALMPAIAQVRLCEIWQQWLAPAFRAAHPWPGFRDGTKAWIDSLGSLAGGDTGQGEAFTSLTWRFVGNAGEEGVAELVLRGRVVATLAYALQPPPPRSGHVDTPYWGLTRLDLVAGENASA